jgi:hypothetical protein
MRYSIFLLLLAIPAIAGESTYTWHTRADDPNRVYLYRDGTQVGGWCYKTKKYRTYDGKDWGPPKSTAPAPLPTRQPVVMIQPNQMPLRLRGPLKVMAVNIMNQIFMEMTFQMLEEIPRALLEALKGR